MLQGIGVPTVFINQSRCLVGSVLAYLTRARVSNPSSDISNKADNGGIFRQEYI